jgi:hypothetical protein
MKRRSGLGILGSLALAILVAGCSNAPLAHPQSSTTTRPAPKSTSAVVKPVTLRIVVCPTTWGISSPSTVPVPESMTIDGRAALAANLAIYSDTDEIMMLVAPKGWSCTASYGADGSGGVSVSPPGTSFPTGRLTPGSAVEAVGGYETGGSGVQAAAEACSYFPAAATATESNLGHSCPPPLVSEKIEPISATIVAFEDAPGVEGPSSASGGKYPSNGVIGYSPVKSPGFFMDACTLPGDEHGICTTALNYFITRYGEG